MEPEHSDQQLAALIDQMLAASPAQVQECFTAELVREALTENFDNWAEARAENSEDGRRPLWDLRMHDRDLENAAFVVWIWEEEAVWLACGMGDSYAVQDFCGQRTAGDLPRAVRGDARTVPDAGRAALAIEQRHRTLDSPHLECRRAAGMNPGGP